VLREQWPTALSFVWDSLRRDVVTVWTSKDPEFTKANRGWLALQGARGVAQFNWRGIGFPRATARPKLDKHSLTLKWDHDIGPITFNVPRLDGGRYHVWRNLRDGAPNWTLGTLWLNERDGELRTVLSYSRPFSAVDVEATRTCCVVIGEPDEQFLTITGPDGAVTCDSISDKDAVGWLKKMKCRREELERRRAACGNPKRPWGHRQGWRAVQNVLSATTATREKGVRDHNHAWTRRIVSRATAWRCGRISVEGLPVEKLAGEPWKWRQFSDFLQYKAGEKGIEVDLGA
jgi:hypothetical protein